MANKKEVVNEYISVLEEYRDLINCAYTPLSYNRIYNCNTMEHLLKRILDIKSAIEQIKWANSDEGKTKLKEIDDKIDSLYLS